MPSDRTCCVPGCDNTRDQFVLHQFPNPEKDIQRFRTWTFAVGGNILVLDDNFVFKYRRICHAHFDQKYATWSRKLAHNAVPTLNLKGVIATRNPLGDVTNKDCAVKDIPIASTSSVIATRNPLGDVTNKDCAVKDIPIASTSSVITTRNTLWDVTDKDCAVKDMPMASTSNLKSKNSTKAFLNKKIVDLQKEIKKVNAIKDKFSTRLKKALKLAENKTFLKTLKTFTTLAAIFTALQFREFKKKKMGRRFTEDEKIMALTIYKRGPRAYRFLSKIFVLPSPVTLSKTISRAGIKPGINDNIFDQLKKRAHSMKPDDKLCSLIFDEMALTPNFNYNRKKDKIVGFVDNGDVVKNQIADHALVFMIRGIFKNYKQPICYSFCAGSTKKEELCNLITLMIKKLHNSGFKVLATICDQGASNVSAINHLIENTKISYLRKGEDLRKAVFEVDGEEIIPLYDVPHLLKGIRNNLLNKNLKFTIDGHVKIAKWDHIVKLYENNPTYKGIKLIKKLTEYHCNPNKIPKMKVKHAAQIFSHSVGINMGFLADHGLLPEECKDTADLLLFFDELFDSMNGSYNHSKKKGGKSLLQALTPRSSHQEIWNKSKNILRSMTFVTREGNSSVVPSITNWLRTLENMEILKNKLFHEYDIKSIWCRHFNQDPIENFFGSIRSHGYRNNSPSCASFEVAFTSLLVNNLSSYYSPGSNCEDDSCYMFKSLKKLFFTSNQPNYQLHTEVDLEDIYNENIIVDLEIKKRDPRVIAALEYVTGFILRQCSMKVFKNCKTCKCNFYTSNENSFIKLREYNKTKAYLTYPSNELIECFSNIQDVINFIVKKKSYIYNIQNYIKVILEARINFNFISCEEHKTGIKDKILTTSCMFFLCNWCRDINKIISGTSKEYDKEDLVQNIAVLYANKRKRN